MKKNFRISHSYYRQKGSALVIVLLMMVVVSLLGMTLLTVTTSNFKMTGIERDYQAVYYIAEAGLREHLYDIESDICDIYNSSDGDDPNTFFAKVIDEFKIGSYNYEQSFGKIPKAIVIFDEPIPSTGNPRTYRIKSEGEIGARKRTVSTEITITWVPKSTSTLLPNVFTLGNRFSFQGNTVNGAGLTAIVDGSLTTGDFNGGSFNGVSNVYINGDLTLNQGIHIGSSTHPGAIYINGNLNLGGGGALHGDVYIAGNLSITNGSINNGKVYVQGNGDLDNGTINGDVYIARNTRIINASLNGKIYSGGNLSLDWMPKGSFYVDYVGSLTNPNYYNQTILSRCTKVSTIPTIPTFKFPQYTIKLRTNETGGTNYTWYQENGYTQYNSNLTLNTIPNNFKAIVEGTFTSSEWTSPFGDTIIISKDGNINISGGSRRITGVLIAPNGSINLNGIASFTGVAISKYGVFMNAGGSTLNAKDLPYFFNQSTVPVIISSTSGSGASVASSDDLLTQFNYNAIREN